MNSSILNREKMISNGDIPRGYKKTNSGIIPINWDDTLLGKRMRIFRGASPRPKGDPKYYGGNVPRLMIQDVTRDGKYTYPCIDSLTEEGAKKSRLLPKGSVVLSCSGTKVGIPGILGIDACIHDGFFGFDSYDNINTEYLYYFFELLNIKLQASATRGGVFNNLTTDIMKEMGVALPKIDEQDEIAEILSTADKCIELKEKLLQEKQKQKKGLMERLLTGRIRVNGFNEKWSTIKLGSAIDVIKKESLQNPQDYNLLTVKLHVKGIEATDKKPNATEKGRPYYLREPGELLIGRQNFHNGGIGVVPKDMKGYIASNAITSLQVINGDLEFYYYYLSNPYFYKRVDNIIGGTGQKEISETMLKKLKVTIPTSVDEQKQIAKIISMADNEVKLLEKEIELLKEQKKGLMQLLLTGIVRVRCN